MNKNKTPTQLMIEAASLRREPERSARQAGVERQQGAERQHSIEELARLLAESLIAHVPAGAEHELGAWLRTSEGAQALRESWPRAVEAYLAQSRAIST
jgi:hypothetical protein